MSLKAEDLMIGNILDFNGMECVVKEIDNQGVVVWIEETKEEEWIDLWQFTPIHITEEWLFKLGLEQDKRNTWLLLPDSSFYLDTKNNKYILYTDYSVTLVEIKYIHELQNLIKVLKYEK